ncbi:MAG: exo-alpha-sialidase [Sedimentisphaerales bacterium]|nr:exo-alpha-sialidase [Sedimentisphaerales bacterium]
MSRTVRVIMIFAAVGGTFTAAGAGAAEFDSVPGHVIFHSPASSGIYVGSPGIAILPNGEYIAKCDEFGPGSSERSSGRTRIFASTDRGESWTERATVGEMYWATVFVHRGGLYLLGNHKCYGDIVISRSTDGGRTWTAVRDAESGRLKTDGQYHCAPVPVLVHNGRIWRAMERLGVENRWGTFQAGVMSAPADADLLQASSWTVTNFLAVPAGHPARHWLEGNVVLSPQGELLNILRSGRPGPVEMAVALRIDADGRGIRLDPDGEWIAMPGAAGKKFTIRHDPESGRYWALINPMLDIHRNDAAPGTVRNTLSLARSKDLRHWEIHRRILYHPDVKKHAFQYPDWVFNGRDIIAAVRTAHDDGLGGAHSAHDANFLTFHRILNFRNIAPAGEQVVIP